MILILFVSFRSIYFGTDVIGYVNRFIELKSYNIKELLSYNFIFSEKDPVFYYVAKVLSFLGVDYQGWLAILSGFFVFTFSIIVHKYSKIPLISFVLMISLGYLAFIMTGLRQGVAISIILLSYKFIREKRLWSFLLVILIASLFHTSALVFLIAYPLSFLRFSRKHIYFFMIILFTHLFFPAQISWLINIITWSEHYDYYLENIKGLNYTGFLIQLIILLFCIIFKKNVIENEEKDITLYNLLFIGLIFQLLSANFAELFRISMYFSIFSTVLVANSINTIKDRYLKALFILILIVISSFYIIWSGTYEGFVFLWN